MVMFAEVVAIGPFGRDLVSHYEYPSELYENTKDGAATIASLFGVAEGTNTGCAFAALLSVDDPWDFNQHKLDASRFDRDGLIEFAAQFEDYKKDVDALFAFMERGYEFYLVPNA